MNDAEKEALAEGRQDAEFWASKEDALRAAIAQLEEARALNAQLMGDDESKPRYTTKRLRHEIEQATATERALRMAAEARLEELTRERDEAKDHLREACGLLVRAKATAHSNLNKQISNFLRAFLHQGGSE